MYISIPRLRELGRDGASALSARGVLYAKSNLKLMLTIGLVRWEFAHPPTRRTPLYPSSVRVHTQRCAGTREQMDGEKINLSNVRREPPASVLAAYPTLFSLPFFVFYLFPVHAHFSYMCEERALYYTDVFAASGQRGSYYYV